MREHGVSVVFMMFNGRDMHSGRQVSIHDIEHEEDFMELNHFWKLAGKVNRVGIPVYFPSQAVHRTGGISVTPATTFSNHGSVSRVSSQAANFSQHGSHLLGSDHDLKTRLAREAAGAFFNTLAQSYLEIPGESLTSLLSRIRYKGPGSSEPLHRVSPPDLDVLNPAHTNTVWRNRGHYAFLYRIVSLLDLRLTRGHHQNTQKKLKDAHSGKSALKNLRRDILPVTLMSRPRPSETSTSNPPQTNTINNHIAHPAPSNNPTNNSPLNDPTETELSGNDEPASGPSHNDNPSNSKRRRSDSNGPKRHGHRKKARHEKEKLAKKGRVGTVSESVVSICYQFKHLSRFML